MVQQLLVFLILFTLGFAHAQDERYYRQILKGEVPQVGPQPFDVKEEHYVVKGKKYLFDLNGDGIEEIIIPNKRDGVDWLEIQNFSQKVIFEQKILALSGESHIYKIKVAHLSDTVKVLLVFLDEGRTIGRRFESTARIFAITFENNDLSTLSMTQGPHHFHEKEAQREQYFSRDYSVEIRDVDNDGTRDIIVSFDHIQRIMLYRGKGEWKRL